MPDSIKSAGSFRFNPLRFSLPPPTTAEERRLMISQAAYYRAERRHFEPGHEVEDWLAAEREVELQLVAADAAEHIAAEGSVEASCAAQAAQRFVMSESISSASKGFTIVRTFGPRFCTTEVNA